MEKRRVGLPGKRLASLTSLPQYLLTGHFDSRQFSTDPLVLELKAAEVGPEPIWKAQHCRKTGVSPWGHRLNVDLT